MPSYDPFQMPCSGGSSLRRGYVEIVNSDSREARELCIHIREEPVAHSSPRRFR